MAEEQTDIFGNLIPEEEDDPVEPDEDVQDNVDPEDDAEPEDDTSDEESEDETLQAEGDEPDDLESARKYWQAAYTRSRQKDRERYGKVEQEHQQYQQLLANFYQDDNYAMQVIRQRFPQLANQISQNGQGQQTPTPSDNNVSSELTQQLQQGEFGFLGSEFGPAIERYVNERIQQEVEKRVGPIEQRSQQQIESERQAEEKRLLAEMDGKYPGWEENHRTDLEELDKFLASDRLTHPKFGNKYEVYYKLINPDAARSEAIEAMQNAAKRRTSFSRSGRGSVPNSSEQVRKAQSNRDAFMLAAKFASEEEG